MKKTLNELTLKDNFMFGAVMCDEENFMTLCEILQDEFIEGRAEGKVESVLVLLSELGEIPNELKDEIIAQKDTNILDK